MLRVLEESQTVFCAGEKGDCVLVSLSTGEEIWRVAYKDLPFDCYNTIHLADVSHDEQTFILGITERYQNDPENVPVHDIDYRKYLLFLDMRTGKLTRSSEPVFPGTDYLCDFTGKGAFSADDKAYIAAVNHRKEDMHYLVRIDATSGKAAYLSRMEDYDRGSDIAVAGMIRAETTGSEAGSPESADSGTASPGTTNPETANSITWGSGTFYYLCEYGSDVYSKGLSGTVRIGFLPDGAGDWSFNSVFTSIGKLNVLPQMLVVDDSLVLVSGTDIVSITKGGVERRASAEKPIVYACPKNEKYIQLVFEDGSLGHCNLSNMTVTAERDALSGQAVSLGIENVRIAQAVGPGTWKEPFCFLSKTDDGKICYCEYFEDKASKAITPTEKAQEAGQVNWFEQGYVYQIPGGDRFLILYNEPADDLSDPDESDYLYRYYGTVYNSEGELLDSFSFVAFFVGTSGDVSFTEDGKKMLCDKYIFDLEDHSLVNLEDVLPEGNSGTRMRSAVIGNSVFSACWDHEILYLFEDGRLAGESRAEQEFKEAEFRSDIEYSEVYSMEMMTAGSNGLVILSGTNGKEASYRQIEGKPVDYFLVYSADLGSWAKIPNALGSDSFPVVCVADKEKWFATFDKEHRLLVYDGETEEIVRDWHLEMDFLEIENMRFVLQDDYILIQGKHNGGFRYRIVRLEDGKTVYTYDATGKSVFGNVTLREDAEHQRLYVYNGFSDMTGVCIDSESWETLFEIPHLFCVPDDRTMITFDYSTGYCKIPLYSRDEMIEMGKAALGQE